ncbi:MAG: hypothetical protein BEN19_08380 [Epulopiscium sp. Nuni2H_MBin003]|nr:MAG: hypothetical protein BEN19_08380 [Epulopiscium sp. Nuni2H_MBin003]
MRERIDDLQRDGYKLIQNPDVFCFGIDAVLLAHYAKVSKKDMSILDIGTGTGIIPILMYAINKKGKYLGIDIQKDMVDMASRSIILNKLEDFIQVNCIDIKLYEQNFKRESFDVITCNPPYMKVASGLKNDNLSRSISRHEIACNLEDVIKASSFILKEKGKLTLIHRTHRLVDIMELMRKYKIEPKRMRMVYPKTDKSPTMVLIEGVKLGNIELKVDKPLIVYNNDNTYTQEIYQIYGKNNLENI